MTDDIKYHPLKRYSEERNIIYREHKHGDLIIATDLSGHVAMLPAPTVLYYVHLISHYF